MTIDLTKILFSDDAPDEGRVQFYVEKIESGEALKRPVVYRQPDGMYGIIDGHCRLEAARRRGATEVIAYVVEVATAGEIETLRRKLNEHHWQGN